MARILVMKNNLLLEEVPFSGDRMQIGREQVNQVHLLDVNISRYHAEIHRRDGSYILKDKNSTNGTSLNGNHIKQAEVLKDQDQIAIGEFTLIFSLDDSDRPHSPKLNQTVYDLNKLV